MWMYFPRDTNNIQLIIIDINRLHFVKCKVMVVINSHYSRQQSLPTYGTTYPVRSLLYFCWSSQYTTASVNAEHCIPHYFTVSNTVEKYNLNVLKAHWPNCRLLYDKKEADLSGHTSALALTSHFKSSSSLAIFTLPQWAATCRGVR